GREGRIGAFGACLGQEAASLGPAYAMGKEDWLIPSFRETPAMLYRGWSMEKLILWYEISVKANAWARDRKRA
ncbi:MAG: pyruvate dehydrogenase (acetyl-transferring) E1 component subunit alpha, partial [bacterium]|nr:pyruvate dehydrogenase (acetyl-transferring) E1 component subunit alpha [bacterium]